jgi:glutathionylspermidine synthase
MAETSWRDEAIALFGKIDVALDGGTQIKLIAEALQNAYEVGIGEGINMEEMMRKENDPKTS